MPKRRKFSEYERELILQRAKGCCEYCLTPHDFTPETFEIEHIIPLSLGGTHNIGNLAFSCSGCNNRKRQNIIGIDASIGLFSPLFNPREDEWKNHFNWAENFTIVEGITSKGKVTIDLLKLNRTGLVNLRRALVTINVHPLV